MRSRRTDRMSTTPLGATFGTILMMALLGWVDITTNASVTGLAAAALSIPHVNPPPKNQADKRVPVTPVPFFVRLRWGDGLPHDLDMWVACHQTVGGTRTNEIIVGYRQKSMGWIDLLRDDLGTPSILNEEQVQSNSDVTRIPAHTTCRINVHLYNSNGGPLPIRGNVIAILNKDGADEYLLGNVAFDLVVPGQEITALTATWGEGGMLIRDSVKAYPAAPQEMVATK